MSTVTMQAPSSWGGVVKNTPSGTVYAPDANALIAVQFQDVSVLLGLGFVTQMSVSAVSNLSVISARNLDGSVIAAAASSGKFGITITPGTAMYLVSEIANNGTKTDTFVLDATVPSGHVTGQNITLDVNANIVIGSGTLSARSLVVTAYPEDGAGGLAANAVASGGTISVSNTAGISSVVITGGTIAGGSRILLEGVLTLVETATQNVSAHINGLALRG